MRFTTWTPPAVASEARRLRRRLWRAVEAQHVVSTLRLVDNAAEQIQLERILEASKPPLPVPAARLHYLLGTPYRYPAPVGSRFRAPTEPGVWYGAEHVRTACADHGCRVVALELRLWASAGRRDSAPWSGGVG